MTWNLYKKCIDKVPQNVEIGFGGFSEAFQNPLCTNMILYAKKKHHRIKIYTTLVSSNLKDIDTLLSNLSLDKGGKDYMYIHLPSVEKFDQIRITKHYKIILKRLVSSNLPNIVFLQHGSLLNKSLTKIMKSRNVQYFPVNSRVGTTPQFLNIKIPKKRGIISCSIKLRDRILLPNGNVVICCQDFGLRHIVGNLYNSKFSDIIKNKKIDFIRSAWADESKDVLCRYCDFAKNDNAKAEFYNTPFSLGKIPLILKVIIYNKFPDFYSYYKNKIKPGKENHYLKW